MNYREAKEQVLKQYDELLPIVEEIKGDKETTYDTILKHMKQSAEEVKNDRFVLMVIGEAKAGKSTFINAYLGKDIMPMDDKQCTSSIVEVRYGEKYTLKTTYADGRTKTIEGDAQIKEFLTSNAAIHDEYRDIPVGIINLQLITSRKGKPVPKEELKAFMKTIQYDKPFSLSPDEYEAKVRQYVETYRPNWANIVAKMEIEYPFKDEALRNVVIVDSPGVGARGGLETVTKEYLEKADAVMFLKSIDGQAMESNAFCDFMESVVANRERNRRAVFMILTRAGKTAAKKGKSNKEYAESLFSRYIDKDQIIAVDSFAELFRQNDILPKTEEEIFA